MKHRIFAGLAFGAALFAIAARTGGAQQNDVGPVPKAVVTPEYTYLPGLPQMIAPAQSHVFLHPQGRYVLITHSEAPLPYTLLLQKTLASHSALFLYDALLHRVRLVWERRGGNRFYSVDDIHWLPESDCALAITWDISDNAIKSIAAATPFDKATLLFFNFAQSLTGRAIATADAPISMQISVSPTKPYFYVFQDETSPNTLRMGSTARDGTLGPASPRPEISVDFDIAGWNAEGTAIYCTHSFRGDPAESYEWFMWDGKTSDMTPLPGKPSKEKFASNLPPSPAPVLSLALRTGAAISVPGTLSPQTPPTPDAKTKAGVSSEASLSAAPPVLLHPLYLEATDAATTQTNPNRSTLVATDADKSYLMPDQSAVLYQKDGATYVVPLTRIKNSAFVQLQKDVTMENARIIKYAIFSGAMGNGGGRFPAKAELTEALKKERSAFGDADRLLRGFVYTPPIIPKRDMDAPETVIIGYIAAPKGRAIIYANESVKWADNP